MAISTAKRLVFLLAWALMVTSCTPEELSRWRVAHHPDFYQLTPSEKCARALERHVAYVATWELVCQDDPPYPPEPTVQGVCYCFAGINPDRFRIIVRTSRISERRLAWVLAHEYGHAWIAQYEGRNSSEDEATAWGERHLRTTD